VSRLVGMSLGLAAMWVALWGDASLGTVAAGLLAGTGVALLVPTPSGDRELVLRPVAATAFAATFVLMLLASTWSVVRLVLSARAGDAYGVLIDVELAPAAYPVRTLVAHSISLTPGTLTVDVGPDGRTLTVHVMDADSVPQARRAIAVLERRACAAFSPHPRTDPEEAPWTPPST
jgi:multicomponent Na+:H+ antiporter subunit E